MSKCREIPLECPHCGASGQYTLWETVNVDLDPSFREKIFNEELFLWECPQCHEKVFIPTGTLYHDMTHDFMIAFQFEEDEKENHEGVDMDIAKLLKMNEGYVYRSVCGLNRLKEKILILENDLDDVAIERIKHCKIRPFCHEYPDCTIFFGGISKEASSETNRGHIFFAIIPKDSENTLQVKIRLEDYYEQLYAVKIDPRMKAQDWACVNENWMSNRLKKTQL